MSDSNKPQELIDYELEKLHKLEEREAKREKLIRIRKGRKDRHFFAQAGRIKEEDE